MIFSNALKTNTPISVINSPGELFFQHHRLRGSYWRGAVIQEGSYFLTAIFSLLTKQNSGQNKLFRPKNETYTVRDELPGELFEGGSYFRCQRREGGVYREGSYSRGGGGSYSRKYGISFSERFLLHCWPGSKLSWHKNVVSSII